MRHPPTQFGVHAGRTLSARGGSATHLDAHSALAPERLQLVLELGRRVTSLLDLQTLLPEACRLIADAFGYDMVGINLLDPLDNQRLYQAAAHPPARLLPRSFRVPLGHGLTGWVARHGTPRLSNDVVQEPLYVSGPAGRHARSSTCPCASASGRSAC